MAKKKPAAGFFLAFIENSVKGTFLKAFSTVISVAFMWTFKAFTKICPNLVITLARKITETYYVDMGAWGGFIAEYLRNMTGEDIDIEELTHAKFLKTSGTAMQAIGEKFLTPMLNMILPGSPEWKEIRDRAAKDHGYTLEEERTLEPFSGVVGAERFLGVNLQFQMSAWLLHLLGDMMSFGSFKSLKDLPNAISWSYGVGWLSWLVMGTPFRLTIADPLEKFLNRIYLPTQLTISQAIDAKLSGYIDNNEFERIRKEGGYNAHNIDILRNLSVKNLTVSDLKNLYYAGYFPFEGEFSYYENGRRITKKGKITFEEFALPELRKMGYNDARAKLIIEIIKKDLEWKLKDKIANNVSSLYVKGEIGEEELKLALRQAGYPDKAIELHITNLEFEKQEKATLSDSMILRLYQNKIMSYTQAISKLLARGYNKNDAVSLLTLYAPSPEKAPTKPTPELTISQLLSAYRKGIISEESIRQELTERGYEPEDIDILIALGK